MFIAGLEGSTSRPEALEGLGCDKGVPRVGSLWHRGSTRTALGYDEHPRGAVLGRVTSV